MNSSWAEPDVRDEVVDYVRYWSDKTGIKTTKMIRWIKITRIKYYNWFNRYGKVNEQNTCIPQKWRKIYSITAFFADDLYVPDNLKVLNSMDMENLTVKDLYGDEFYESFTEKLSQECSVPKIYSGMGYLERVN